MVRVIPAQKGALNVLVLPLVAVSLLLVVSLVFAVYSYSGMQDYKNNSDEKSATASAAAVKVANAKQAAEFAEESKNPLKTYNGPAAFGSVQVHYPKNWSAYVVEQTSGTANVDAYFNPNFVPSVTAQSSSFALRVRVVGQSYASELQKFQSAIKNNKVTAAPYAFSKVPNTVGTKLTGAIQSNQQGTMILVPLRDNTLEVWTEGNASLPDFEKYILPNLSFAP